MQRFMMLCACALIPALCLVSQAGADPIKVNFQGGSTAAGEPTTSTHDVNHRIFSGPSGGSPLWSELHPAVLFTKGLFNVTLGSIEPLSSDVFAPPSSGSGVPVERYLEIQIDGDPPLAPRILLVSVPYAVAAHRVSGDIETAPGEMRLGGMSGSTTGTIRMMATPDSTDSYWFADSDADGLYDGEVRLRLRPRDGLAGGAARLEVSTDRFASGPRQSVSLDGSYDRAEMRCATDVNLDGIADVVVGGSTDADSAGLFVKHHCCPGHITLRSGMSGSTTGTIRMTSSLDSTGEVVDHDSDGDGHAESKFTITARDQFGNCQLATDTDDDGVADHSVTTDCDDTDARLIVSNIGSSGQDGVSIDVNDASRRLSVGGIGSSGQDGVDMEVTPSLRRLTVGNIGSSGQDGVSMEVDATSRRLTVGNIGSSGQDGVSVDVRSSSSKIGVHNIGSSGNDGVSMEAGPYYASFKVGETGIADQETFCVEKDALLGVRVGIDTLPTDHKLSIGGGGAYCDGTSWVNGSDKNSKENFEDVDGEEILKRIEGLPISRWNYKSEGDAVKHIGPTAQDFKATFGVGANDKSISTIDPSGIALAAIKALQKQNQYLQTENEQLREALENLNRKVDKLAASR